MLPVDLHKRQFFNLSVPYVYCNQEQINLREYIPKGQSKKDNQDKLVTRRRKTKQKHNIKCVGHHYAQTNTKSVNKTFTLPQTTGGKDDPNIVLCSPSHKQLEVKMTRTSCYVHPPTNNWR
jgi:hypothetical protein